VRPFRRSGVGDRPDNALTWVTRMRSAEGVIILVEEGRFALVRDDGRVMPFLLAHNASLEPQDLPLLKRDQRRVLQAGEALAPAEPWTSMANTGLW